MSNHGSVSDVQPGTVASSLSLLVDDWVEKLSGNEFRLSAFVYRAVERNGGTPVRMSAQQVAEGVGLAERTVESLRKRLAEKGVIHLLSTPQGAWLSIPGVPLMAEQPPEDSQKPDSANNPETKIQTQINGSTNITAAQAASAPDTAHLESCAQDAGPDKGSPSASTHEIAKPLELALPIWPAPPKVQAELMGTAPAETESRTAAFVRQADDPGPAGLSFAEPGFAEPGFAGQRSAKLGEPDLAGSAKCVEQGVAGSAKSGGLDSAGRAAAEPGKPASAPMNVAANLEENLTLAVKQLLEQAPDKEFVQLLRNDLSDDGLLLECLQWMLRRGHRYDTCELLRCQISDQCHPDPYGALRPFLDERRSLKQRRP